MTSYDKRLVAKAAVGAVGVIAAAFAAAATRSNYAWLGLILVGVIVEDIK